jgi:hypothetical protein
MKITRKFPAEHSPQDEPCSVGFDGNMQCSVRFFWIARCRVRLQAGTVYFFHYTAVILNLLHCTRCVVNILNVSELTSFLFGRNFLVYILDFGVLKLQNPLNLKPGYWTVLPARLVVCRLFFFSFSGWGETESTWYVGHFWSIVPAPDDRWWLWSSWRNEDWQGKPKYSEKTCPSATLPATNFTWPDLGSNAGRRGEKPATNRLSYGTAL